jgi:opacity protein-like surface antigen
MRLFVWALFACASVICAAHAASAQSPWYIEGSAGTQVRLDSSRSTTFRNLNNGAAGPGTNTASFDAGYVVNLGLGYKLPFGVRVEGELGYAHYSVNGITPVSTDGTFPVLNGSRVALQSGGGMDQGSATVNAFYDLPVPGRFVPYIGVGFGAVLISEQATRFANSSGTVQFNQNSSSIILPAMLGEVGLTIALDANWAAVPSYRFQHVFTQAGTFIDDSNIFKLGLRYSF